MPIDDATPEPATAAPPPSPDGPDRRPRRHAGVLAFVAVVAVFAGVLATVVVARRAAQVPVEPARPEIAAAPRDGGTAVAPPRPASAAARRLTVFTSEPIDALAPAGEVGGRLDPTLTPPPPYDAIDSTLIDAGDRRYRLVEAIAVGRDEVCRRRDGTLFACGLSGRAVLQNFLRGKRLVCDPLFVDVDRRADFVSARCRAGGHDLATMMIEAGLARPSALAGAAHREAMERARQAGRGIWAGTPPERDDDPALADDRAVAFGSTRIAAPEAPPPEPAQP